MTHEDYEKIENYWKTVDVSSVKMQRDEALKEAETYIKANNTCALATGYEEFVRCTPIEYTYHDDAFWMFSEGGEKFYGLEHNRAVCIAIYDKYDGFGNLKGMQITGVAEIVKPFSEEYVAAAEYKKIPVKALKELPHTMNLIKVIPKRIDYLNSDFKKVGYSSRQAVEFE